MNNKDDNRDGGTVGYDYLSNLIKTLGETPSTESQKQEPQVNTPTALSSDLFSSLLSNPELLAKLPSIIATVKPILEMLATTTSPVSVPSAASPQGITYDAKSKGNSLPAEALTKSHGCHAALLCALKPYLSEERCRAIDYIIKIDRLGDVLKTL